MAHDEMMMELVATNVERRAIAAAFDKAAISYDRHAELQRIVGQLLMAKLPQDLTGCKVLELGCGTGFFTQQLALRGAQVVALDISCQMLQQCRQRCQGMAVQYCLADAQALPFADKQFDIVFSSLALQWCRDWTPVLRQLKRMVKPSGQCLFSTLGQESLFELQQAWQKVDTYQHVNQFHSATELKIVLAQSGCHHYHLDWQTIVMRYGSAFELMKDLKGIGQRMF